MDVFVWCLGIGGTQMEPLQCKLMQTHTCKLNNSANHSTTNNNYTSLFRHLWKRRSDGQTLMLYVCLIHDTLVCDLA